MVELGGVWVPTCHNRVGIFFPLSTFPLDGVLGSKTRVCILDFSVGAVFSAVSVWPFAARVLFLFYKLSNFLILSFPSFIMKFPDGHFGFCNWCGVTCDEHATGVLLALSILPSSAPTLAHQTRLVVK